MTHAPPRILSLAGSGSRARWFTQHSSQPLETVLPGWSHPETSSPSSKDPRSADLEAPVAVKNLAIHPRALAGKQESHQVCRVLGRAEPTGGRRADAPAARRF